MKFEIQFCIDYNAGCACQVHLLISLLTTKNKMALPIWQSHSIFWKPPEPESVSDNKYLKIRVIRVICVISDSDNSTIECPCQFDVLA